jgi:hypothetical protein
VFIGGLRQLGPAHGDCSTGVQFGLEQRYRTKSVRSDILAIAYDAIQLGNFDKFAGGGKNPERLQNGMGPDKDSDSECAGGKQKATRNVDHWSSTSGTEFC